MSWNVCRVHKLGHIVRDLTELSPVKTSPARTPLLDAAPASTQPSHIAIVSRTDMSQQPFELSRRATPANLKPASLDFDPSMTAWVLRRGAPRVWRPDRGKRWLFTFHNFKPRHFPTTHMCISPLLTAHSRALDARKSKERLPTPLPSVSRSVSRVNCDRRKRAVCSGVFVRIRNSTGDSPPA